MKYDDTKMKTFLKKKSFKASFKSADIFSKSLR